MRAGRSTPAVVSLSFDTGRVAGAFLVWLLVQWSWDFTVRGQEPDSPPGTGARQDGSTGILAGRVLVGDRPADTGTVVLHRVSGEMSGEVDSVGVEPGGFFQLGLPEAPGTGDQIFFATMRHQGILYFGRPFSGLPDPGGSYVIQAYPAQPAGPDARPRLQVRNVVAARPDSGKGWTVADFFELHNGVPATLVSGENGPTWSHALPRGARDLRVGQSDLSPGMASLRDGRVSVSAPIRPGGSLYLFQYVIPDDGFSIPVEVAIGSMELLVREPAGDLSVTGLAAVEGVELEGVGYRRFAGRDVAPSDITVTTGETRMPSGSLSLVAVFVTLLLAGAGALLAARSRNPAVIPLRSRRRRVLVEIARLDEEWTDGRLVEEDYRGRRASLLERLRP